jgi:hypothetical protein
VAFDPASQQRLGEVLVQFGFAPRSVKQPLFTAERTVLRMGVPPNRLEIICNIAGVDFAECYARRRTMDIDGLPVPVIDYDDLVRNKRAAGRANDLADVERLQNRHKKP